MKILRRVKPILEEHKCSMPDCKEQAVTRLYNRLLCRKHYLILIFQAREKRKNGKQQAEQQTLH